jgi:hypothetical protein
LMVGIDRFQNKTEHCSPYWLGGFNRSEQHLELEVCTWEDRKVRRQQSPGGPHCGFQVTRVCDASTVRRSGLRSLDVIEPHRRV